VFIRVDAINSILFHRGVYPAEDFYVEKRFGLDLTLILVSSVEDYIELTLHRLRGIYPLIHAITISVLTFRPAHESGS
jgi:hypothetical protein